jgi:hypothetical protein
MILAGGFGVIGVAVCVALVESAMRAGNAPEPVAISEVEETAPAVKKLERFEPALGAAETESPARAEVRQTSAPGLPGPSVGNARLRVKRAAAAMDLGTGFWDQARVSKDEARVALSSVGADAGAETVWWLAINDLSLDPEVRRDLIEDLNEDGFSDPKHPGKEDLPLIESRIMLIEELSREPMDDVNGDAFAEAYKDLLNMQGRLEGQ